MTTTLHDLVVVEPSGLVRVCAWCLPAIRLAELHRAHRCTDGICEACAARLALGGHVMIPAHEGR